MHRPPSSKQDPEERDLPILDDLPPELSHAEVFSTVDLTAGYWHCVLDEESSLLTTFSTPFGRYKWNRLPFAGLQVASSKNIGLNIGTIYQKYRENGKIIGKI